uniref:Uncharacterized protein n=1 Tax=Timema monikensis TaxID=170555 RepID=A0A7R9EA92_9NEOP|nr:unnamed protein product [Timema monikensis]
MASLVLTDSSQLTALKSYQTKLSVSCQSAPKKPWGYCRCSRFVATLALPPEQSVSEWDSSLNLPFEGKPDKTRLTPFSTFPIGRTNNPLFCLFHSTVYVLKAIRDEFPTVLSAHENSVLYWLAWRPLSLTFSRANGKLPFLPLDKARQQWTVFSAAVPLSEASRRVATQTGCNVAKKLLDQHLYSQVFLHSSVWWPLIQERLSKKSSGSVGVGRGRSSVPLGETDSASGWQRQPTNRNCETSVLVSPAPTKRDTVVDRLTSRRNGERFPGYSRGRKSADCRHRNEYTPSSSTQPPSPNFQLYSPPLKISEFFDRDSGVDAGPELDRTANKHWIGRRTGTGFDRKYIVTRYTRGGLERRWLVDRRLATTRYWPRKETGFSRKHCRRKWDRRHQFVHHHHPELVMLDMAPGTSTMLRARRKDINVKPNRRLDRKSSRGMLYENEELRLRTININAEVEKAKLSMWVCANSFDSDFVSNQSANLPLEDLQELEMT